MCGLYCLVLQAVWTPTKALPGRYIEHREVRPGTPLPETESVILPGTTSQCADTHTLCHTHTHTHRHTHTHTHTHTHNHVETFKMELTRTCAADHPMVSVYMT